MDNKQAEQIIRQICVSYKGTLEEHKAIQEALRIVFAPPVKEEVVEKGD